MLERPPRCPRARCALGRLGLAGRAYPIGASAASDMLALRSPREASARHRLSGPHVTYWLACLAPGGHAVEGAHAPPSDIDLDRIGFGGITGIGPDGGLGCIQHIASSWHRLLSRPARYAARIAPYDRPTITHNDNNLETISRQGRSGELDPHPGGADHQGPLMRSVRPTGMAPTPLRHQGISGFRRQLRLIHAARLCMSTSGAA